MQVTFTSPWFVPTAGVARLEFSHIFVEGFSLSLELQYLQGEVWRNLWSRSDSGGKAWHRVKVTIPAGTRRLRFVSAGLLMVQAVDEVVAWESESEASEIISLCSGHDHSCAGHVNSGQVKCWGSSNAGKLGSGGQASIGDGPNEMGDSLPAVDLGGGAIESVACGWQFSCAVFEDGTVKCWGYNFNGQIGYSTAASSLGWHPSHMGSSLPPVDLGAGAVVESVTCGGFHTCALLRGGHVKCFGMSALLGLGGVPAPELIVGWQL